MRDTGCETNARESQAQTDPAKVGSTITPIEFGRSLRFAETNGAKVISAVDLPEPILVALAGLVDAIAREYGDITAQRLAAEADQQPKPMCRWHPGQYAEHCGPCRSEIIARDVP